MKFFTSLKAGLLAASLLFSAGSAVAQKAYVKLGGGYNWGVGSESHEHHSAVIPYSGQWDVTIRKAAINYGKGGTFSAAAGYMFTDNIGAELALAYLRGKVNTAESDQYYSNYGAHVSTIFEHSARMLLFKPAFVLAVGNGSIQPYAKMGLTVALGTILEYQKDNNIGFPSIEREYEYSGGTGFGFHGGIGANFKASERLNLYAEIGFNNLSYAPEKGELTKYTENNVNAMGTRTRYDREIEFVDDYQTKYDPSGKRFVVSDYDVPQQRLKKQLPFSSIGLEFGLKYNL